MSDPTESTTELRDLITAARERNRPVTHYPPDCCASCEYLSDLGRCQHHGPVPLEFIEQENDCGEYLPRVPF